MQQCGFGVRHFDPFEPVIQNSFQSSIMLTNCCLAVCVFWVFEAGLVAGESRVACNTFFFFCLTLNNNPGIFGPRVISF